MKKLIQKTFTHWRASNASRMGAALSYYAMLSIVPLMLLIIAAAAMLFSKDVVENAVMHQLVTTIGSNASLYISEMLHNTELQDISLKAAIVSAITFIIGAIGVFSELNQDLEELWCVPARSPKKKVSLLKKIGVFIHEKIMVLSVIPLLALLLSISIVITLFLSIAQTAFFVTSPFGFIVSIVQIAVPLVLSTVLFTVIYRVLPKQKLPWSVLVVGGFITSALFGIGNILITGYIKLLVHTSVFGGASSLVGLLVWIYYSAQVFFLGASFTYIYGKSKGLTRGSDSLQS